MYVVTLTGFRPTPRYDSIPWTDARIDEGPTIEGPWTAIETITLVPDEDPTRPAARDLTTEEATLAMGWYRVTFIDGDGDTSNPTSPVSAGATAPHLPGVEEVALWIRARTKDNLGNEIGTFTADTRPTEAEVSKLVALTGGSMVSCVGPWLPESLWERSRLVVALKTAMIVELSYFPEQIERDHSPYKYLKELFDYESQALCAVAEQFIPDDVPTPLGDLPLFYFGDGTQVVWDRGYRPSNEALYGYGERPVVQWWSV